MERTPLHDLSRDELIGLNLRLQKQLADLEQRNSVWAFLSEKARIIPKSPARTTKANDLFALRLRIAARVAQAKPNSVPAVARSLEASWILCGCTC